MGASRDGRFLAVLARSALLGPPFRADPRDLVTLEDRVINLIINFKTIDSYPKLTMYVKPIVEIILLLVT